MANLDALRKSKLFMGLSESELKKIEECFHEDTVEIGNIIIEENDVPIDKLFIVKEGTISVSTSASYESEEKMLTTLGPGDAFGEISLVDRNPHSATVRALSDTVILSMQIELFNRIFDSDRNIGFIIMRNLCLLICDRLRVANFTIKHFGYFGKDENTSIDNKKE